MVIISFPTDIIILLVNSAFELVNKSIERRITELNKSNSLKFKTRENFTTDATEFYNISYQYENDCLRAAIEYNKSFYADNDLEPSDNLMFTLTIIPFGKLSTPTRLD